MKFKDMKYERPDIEALQAQYAAVTERLKKAESWEEADAAFLAEDALNRHVRTVTTLATIRRDINTKDPYYFEEARFCEASEPLFTECEQNFIQALLASTYRKNFEEKYGDLMFVNAELALKSFKPELIPDLQKENELASEYENLLASAQVEFQGKVYTLSQMVPFKADRDDAIRLAAWKAEGAWYKTVQKDLDRIYDELVKLRDKMGKSLGFEDFTGLGYCRMKRNCYTKEDLDHFHTAVQKYVVPVAEIIYKQQAERLGKEYPLSFADAELGFRSGNPVPQGNAEDLVAVAKAFYDAQSPETAAFFRDMLDGEVMDLLSTEGKRGGGYCTSLPDYEVPFIFANFNGTEGDVTVLTHEGGHAFEAWLNRKRVPVSYIWPSSEACEVHSTSMEFFAERFVEEFYGKDADKSLYSHLAAELKFIPYGTLVDHFQHIVYEKPEMTPEERHAVWKGLMGVYMPWMKLDGDIPFYGEGQHWQRQHHIYSYPFYYIDYCLALTVVLELWALMQEDRDLAWKKYMDYTEQGGSHTFTVLLKNAGLSSPFEGDTLKEICGKAAAFLQKFDMETLDR